MNDFRIETPLGAIIVRDSGGDTEHPGIWVELRHPGSDFDAPIAMIEYDGDEKAVVSRVWDNVNDDDYTTKVKHYGLDEFYRTD